MIGSGTARVRIEQLEIESQAMKQIALNGGGPDEQRVGAQPVHRRQPRAAGGRGDRPGDATATAPRHRSRPMPSDPRSPAVRRRGLRRSGPPRRTGTRQRPADRRLDRRSAASATCSPAADSMSRPAPSRPWAMPRSSAAWSPATARPRFPRRPRAAARCIVCAWDPIRRRRPPASSPTGSSVQAMVMLVSWRIDRILVALLVVAGLAGAAMGSLPSSRSPSVRAAAAGQAGAEAAGQAAKPAAKRQGRAGRRPRPCRRRRSASRHAGAVRLHGRSADLDGAAVQGRRQADASVVDGEDDDDLHRSSRN